MCNLKFTQRITESRYAGFQNASCFVSARFWRRTAVDRLADRLGLSNKNLLQAEGDSAADQFRHTSRLLGIQLVDEDTKE